MTEPSWVTWVAIGGNTYPVRYQLAALGGTFDALSRTWRVPAYQAHAAREAISRHAEAARKDKRRLKKQRKQAKASRPQSALSSDMRPRLVKAAS